MTNQFILLFFLDEMYLGQKLVGWAITKDLVLATWD